MKLRQDWFLTDLVATQKNDILVEDRKLDLLLTIPELADYLKISTRSVRRLIDSNKLEIQPVGGQIRIPMKSVKLYQKEEKQRWIEKKQEKQTLDKSDEG